MLHGPTVFLLERRSKTWLQPVVSSTIQVKFRVVLSYFPRKNADFCLVEVHHLPCLLYILVLRFAMYVNPVDSGNCAIKLMLKDKCNWTLECHIHLLLALIYLLGSTCIFCEKGQIYIVNGT